MTGNSVHIIRKNFLLILYNIMLALVTNVETKAQQANNWYFYNRAGITFNTIPPSALTDGQSENFGSACMSDENGKLLFYSDATQVWNRQQQIMPNGNNLWGACAVVGSNFSTTIQFPNNPDLYYLFLGECYNNPPSGYSSYNYSVIDKTLNGGLGGIILKNQLIARPAGERMTTAMHSNGIESWLVTLERGNLIYNTFRINCNGISPIATRDTFELHNPLDSFYYVGAGDMKTSFQNDRLAVSFQTRDKGWIDLYKFNNITGHLFDNKRISFETHSPGSIDNPQDIVFSKNGKYLYPSESISGNVINNSVTIQLCRYDISVWDSATIKNSRQVLFSPSYLYLIGLQIGPDYDLYFVRGDYLGVVKNHNSVNPIIIDSFINLSPGTNAYYLPKFASNLISNQNVQVAYSVAPDCRTVTLNAKTYIKGNKLAFKWKFGDGDSSTQNIPGGSDTTYTTIVHTYPPGIDTFFVSLTVTSDTVCGLGRGGARVVVKPPPPIANFGFSAGICGGERVQFTDSSLLNFNPSLTYQWAYKRAASFDAFTNFSIDSNPVFTFDFIDSFEVRLTVTSRLSCVPNNSITKRIYLTAPPTAAFTTSDTCTGNIIRLQNNSTGNIISYKWLFGNGDSSTSALPVYAYSAAGNYNILLSVVTANNCFASVTQSITINPTPVASFSITKSCLGESISIVNNSSGAISSYNWLASDGQKFIDPNPAILFNDQGNYTLALKVQSSFGCSDSITSPIIINEVKITATSDTSIIINQPLQLTANGAANYFWQPASNLNSTSSSNPIFKTSNSGIYPVLVEGTTAQGCKGTAAITIKVFNLKAGLLLPNAFSPNGDNINDLFRLNCTGLQSLGFFRIYNRYGQVIYEQQTCSNFVGWDGKFKGIAQNSGAYVYIWQGVDFNGELLNGKGTVLLLR